MSIGAIILILVVLALIGVLPTWGYSNSWGYGPTGGIGLVVRCADRAFVDGEDLMLRQAAVPAPRPGAAQTLSAEC